MLGDVALRALASALRAGRLVTPYRVLNVRLHCTEAGADIVTGELERLAGEGMKPHQIAILLEAVIHARMWVQSSNEGVELVCTGPMGSCVPPRDTGVVMRELFAQAREQVAVIGYAIHRGKEVFEVLARRMEEIPSLDVRMYLDVRREKGDDLSEGELLARFVRRFREAQWPGRRLPEVFYDPRSLSLDRTKRSSLHAKCIVIDRQTAFVSSANFTEAAQRRNIEVGTLIRSHRLASQLGDHFEGLVVAGLLRPLVLKQ